MQGMVVIIHPLLAVKSTVRTTVMAHWVQLVSGSLLLGCLHVKGVLLVMAHEVYLCLKDLLVNLRAFYFILVSRFGGRGRGRRKSGCYTLFVHARNYSKGHVSELGA